MNKKATSIIIAGGSASGKSTIGKKITDELLKGKSVVYVCMDNYYREYGSLSFEERVKINFDHPNSYDMELLYDHLVKLINFEAIDMPIYNFKTHSREKDQTIHVKPGDVIILDGILALYLEKLRDLAQIKIFVQTANDVRFIRRLLRDINERGRELNNVVEQYLTFVKPMHEAFVEPIKVYADIIIPYYEGNDVAIDLIATKVNGLLK